MTSESKILTVSYGTFSCTLEGFDNPFDTMKAIAEYFRDLAAQDRHFGAEPPPPDAAMLHRLAEREVARLADKTARRDGAALDGDMPAEPSVSPRIQFNPAPNRRRARFPDETGLAGDADGSSDEPSLQDVIPEGVAAKLARIRRSVQPLAADGAAGSAEALAADLPDMDLPEPEAPAPAEAEDALMDAADRAFAVDTPVADEAEAAVEEGPVEAPIEAPVETALSETTVAETALDEGPDMAMRLDALVADDSEAMTPAAAYAEAFDPFNDAEFGAIQPEESVTDAADLADLAALDGGMPDAASLDAAADRAAIEEPLPEDMALVEAEGPADAVTLAAEDPLPEEFTAAGDELPEAEMAFFHAEADDLAVAEQPIGLGPAEDEFAQDAPLPAAEAPVAAVADLDAPALDEPQPDVKAAKRSRRLNSRVVRLHPDQDGDAADAAAALDRESESQEVSRLMQQAEEVMAEETNRRRQEALSRLKAAVASTEADRADLDYEAPRADVNLDPYRDDLAEAIQPDEPEAPAAPPEVKPTRRKSVSIRPQEPRPGTIRPGMISPPPLVLVSEQRIDRVSPTSAPASAPTPAAAQAPAPTMAPASPGIAPANPDGQPMVALRTGRLSGAIGAGAAVAASAAPARNIVLEKPSYGPATEVADDEDLADDSVEIDESGLAAFAETVGARSMAELLEAAAAYATCVEKRAQFTRPQLMRRMIASAGGKPVSREDGLRSFGTLLRTGRIEKVTRGHYSLAETSPYLAEARRLG